MQTLFTVLKWIAMAVGTILFILLWSVIYDFIFPLLMIAGVILFPFGIVIAVYSTYKEQGLFAAILALTFITIIILTIIHQYGSW